MNTLILCATLALNGYAGTGGTATKTSVTAAQEIFDRNDFQSALTAFSRISEGSPSQDRDYALMMIGICYQHMDKLDQAEKSFRTYLAKSQPTGDGYYYFGELLELRGKKDEATQMFQKALDSKNNPPWVEDLARRRLGIQVPHRSLTEIAQELFDEHEFKLALPVFQRVVEKQHKSAEASYAEMMIAQCHDSLGAADKAQRDYEVYVRDFHPDGPGYFFFGSFLARQGKTAQSRAMFDKALRVPNNPPWIRPSVQEELKKLKKTPAKKG